MAACVREINYRCSDDCRMEGCPGHKGILNYQSVSDAYSFSMNGRILHFERGELEAMVSLLGSLSQERADAIELRRPAPAEASGQVPALEVFRIAGGDVECCPNPTPEQALACLRDLRECYDESLASGQDNAPGEGVVAGKIVGACLATTKES